MKLEIKSVKKGKNTFYNCFIQIKEKIVSSLQLRVKFNSKRNQRYGIIKKVFTHSSYRKKGFARSLMNSVIEFATHEGLYKIILVSKPEFISFFERAGFRKYKTHMRLNILKNTSTL